MTNRPNIRRALAYAIAITQHPLVNDASLDYANKIIEALEKELGIPADQSALNVKAPNAS